MSGADPAARAAQRLSGALHDPIVWTRAQGVNVWDADGNRYVDPSAGFGAASLRHGHPEVVRAVQAQAGELVRMRSEICIRRT